MTTPSRRDLFKTGASLAALGALGPFSGAALAAMGPNDKFDLLIRNANALDAGSGLAGKRDLGIRYGLIESIEPTIAPERAQRVMDAGGKLVTPGLIDLHCHTYFRAALYNPVRPVIVRTRAVRRVAFIANSVAIGCKKRLAAHPDPHATVPQRLSKAALRLRHRHSGR